MTDSVETTKNEFTEGKLKCGDKNIEECKKELNEMKKKWEITIDIMMIIGKYFENCKDYVNVMKSAKKYHDFDTYVSFQSDQ